MAKTSRVNKTQAVLEYLKSHPAAVSSEIAQVLNKRGVKITSGYVANIKTKFKVKRSAKAADSATVELPTLAMSATEKPQKPARAGETVTLEQIKAVAQTARATGGFGRLRELLALIREIGGPKKFNDLLDAMAATELDDIPF